jgi:hypothetical protein
VAEDAVAEHALSPGLELRDFGVPPEAQLRQIPQARSADRCATRSR